MFTKEKQLERLNKEITQLAEERNKEWLGGNFIPSDYLHQYEVIFVGLKSSDYFLKNPNKKYLGNFNVLPTDFKLQKRMAKFGFGGSYITDIVKFSGRPKECASILEKEIEICLPFLAEEIKIINPKVVVAMGNETYKILQGNRKSLGIKKLFKIFHPTGTAAKTEKERNEQFRELQKTIKNKF